MSAIFGILRFDGEAVSAADLERMAGVLRHRGPDGRKWLADGPFGVGHCLMRVNQEDWFEAQPIQDGDVTLVADCRIDNRDQLAEMLGLGAGELADVPDSELVLRAYRAWGEDCAAHLVGDFAFAVWDARAGKLVLGRDHMGQRNLFYHRGETFLAFASEIKALWALADVPREWPDEEIARFFYKLGEQRAEGATFYAGISATPGGSIVTAIRNGTLERRRYWSPRADPAHENRDEAYYVGQYRAVLAEAVACRLRRLTAPAALMMSAGFDTAAIAGLARPVVEAQQRKLISLSWLGEASELTTRGDLRPWLAACRRVMPHLDVRELSGERQSPLAGIERMFLAHDGPGAASRRTTGHLFAEASAAGARLIMDGYGGDYTLNPRGYGALARLLRQGRLRAFFAELRAHLRRTDQSLWQVFKHDIVQMLLPRPVIRWQRQIRGIGAPAWARSARRAVAGPDLDQLRRRSAGEAGPGVESIPFTAMRALSLDLATKVSRSFAATGAAPAGAHGLELTRPFHDKRVVELALAVPEDLYVKDGLSRYLARRALADVYPPEFRTRGRRNEGALGDAPILDLAAPELLAEADRLANGGRFADRFDFQRVRHALAAPDGTHAMAARKSAALKALLTARFVEWLSGANAG
jgi:asparagine synthase (glutamine-hydrolysing)